MSADLDDFFAKKDKNRKKKTKGISNEDFVQKYEAKCKEMISEKRHEEVLSNLEGFIQDDGEWKDFEEEKDYTGLKIQILTLDDEEQREKEEEEIKKEVTEVPWAKKENDKKEEDETKNEVKTEEEEKPKEPEPEKPEEKVSLFFKFRQKEAGKAVAPGPRLDDESEFPDLGAMPEETKQPTTVNRTTPSIRSAPPAPPPPLRSDFSTGNKYNLLRNNN